MISAINQYRSNLINHSLCDGGISTIKENIQTEKKLVRILDVLGKDILDQKTNMILLYIYNDGSVEKKVIIE